MIVNRTSITQFPYPNHWTSGSHWAFCSLHSAFCVLQNAFAGFQQGVTNRSKSIIEKLIDKSVKWILLDKNRLLSLKNGSKSVITKYWGMCINFIVIHGRPKDTREIWGNQEKSITQSAIERIVDKLKKRVFQGITMVACSLFHLIATACYCKLLCSFFIVIGLLTGNQCWSTALVSASTLILALPDFWLLFKSKVLLLSDCV